MTENMKKYYQEHEEEIKEYQRGYYQQHKEKMNVTSAQWRQDHKEEVRNYRIEHKKERKVWQQSEKGKAFRKRYFQSEKGKAAYKRHKIKYPERIKAINYANKHNLRGTNCYVCNSTENLHGHHPNYSQKEWIITLCQKHHDNVKIIRRNLLEGIKEAFLLRNYVGIRK